MATCSLRAVSASLLSLSSSRSSPSLTLTCSAHRRLSENKLQQPEQMSNRQLQNQHFDIEAAHQTQTVSPSSGSSRHLSTLQQQQQDGDPFHRRTGAVVTHDSETTKTSTTVVLVPDALGCSVRSGNFTAADLDANSAAARSRGAATNGKPLVATAEPRLLHPVLLKIPLHIRFGCNGLLSNILFMVAYNYAVMMFEHRVAVSTIYSIVYFIFIPLGHAFVSLLVFGWPDRYITSLMNNFPIGLTAIAIGGILTGYLDSIQFSDRVEDFIRNNFTFSKMPPRVAADEVDEESQFWSSLLVLTVTSMWTYVLSIFINSVPTNSEKKEL